MRKAYPCARRSTSSETDIAASPSAPARLRLAAMLGAPTGVERTLRELAGRLDDEIDEIVETMLPRMRAEVPDFDVGSRPELRDAERASIYGNIRAVLGALAGDRTQPDAPAEAMEEARITAR